MGAKQFVHKLEIVTSARSKPGTYQFIAKTLPHYRAALRSGAIVVDGLGTVEEFNRDPRKLNRSADRSKVGSTLHRATVPVELGDRVSQHSMIAHNGAFGNRFFTIF